MLARVFQQSGLSSLILRSGASFTSTTSLRGLEEIIPTLPKEGEQQPTTGRAWEASDLRKKSWDDLHKLWYVLLKQRNMLQSERLAYKQSKKSMPDPSRLTKVRKSMGRIKQVLSERLEEHDDLNVRLQLKTFIDAM